MTDSSPTDRCPPCLIEPDAPVSGFFENERGGSFNEDERTFVSFCPDCAELHNVRCSLVEFDDSDDDVLRWFVRCRDRHFDEEILVEQHRHTYERQAYQKPERFHSAAMGFVSGEPECLSEEF